jgi:hypothetical protein
MVSPLFAQASLVTAAPLLEALGPLVVDAAGHGELGTTIAQSLAVISHVTESPLAALTAAADGTVNFAGLQAALAAATAVIAGAVAAAPEGAAHMKALLSWGAREGRGRWLCKDCAHTCGAAAGARQHLCVYVVCAPACVHGRVHGARNMWFALVSCFVCVLRAIMWRSRTH